MNTPSEKSAMLFGSLVMMFSSQAMMALGKLANPVTGAIDRDMQGAQFMIDLIEMLEERTAGNRTDEESRMLSTTLRDLRLNYVAEAGKGVNPASPAADAPEIAQSEEGVPDNVA